MQNSIQESISFNKNIKKSCLLIIGVKGQNSTSFSFCFCFSLIVLLIIRDRPLLFKNKLI